MLHYEIVLTFCYSFVSKFYLLSIFGHTYRSTGCKR